MNFLIFRDLGILGIMGLGIFLYMSRVNIAEHSHVAMAVNATWRRIYAYVCSHMHACVRESD